MRGLSSLLFALVPLLASMPLHVKIGLYGLAMASSVYHINPTKLTDAVDGAFITYVTACYTLHYMPTPWIPLVLAVASILENYQYDTYWIKRFSFVICAIYMTYLQKYLLIPFVPSIMSYISANNIWTQQHRFMWHGGQALYIYGGAITHWTA